MKYSYRPCAVCEQDFQYEKKRGRPPEKCKKCKDKKSPSRDSIEEELRKAEEELERLREKKFTSSSNKIEEALSQARVSYPSNTPVRVLERVWRGVPIPSRTGRISSWKTDIYGPVAVIILRGGSECLARPEMMEKR